MPDLTIILDAPIGQLRVRRGSETDAFEARGLEFHHAVREAFLEIAEEEPGRCVIIDALQSPDEVLSHALRAIKAHFGSFAGGMSNIAWPLFGHGSAEAQFKDAALSGNLHHGWLLEGPSGIGKSLLAKRMSSFILGAENSSAETLDAYSDDSVVQKIIAESHPDLRWVARRPDDKGKVKQDIPVDEVRSLNHFFSLKSGLGGWRVGVIDSLDELNRNGANALLKTLEEPPAKCLLILISHGTRTVLPTIKSRCRTLRMRAISDDDTIAALKTAKVDDARSLSKLARGRPGLGIKLSTPNSMAAASATRSYLRALPRPSDTLMAQVIRTAGADAVAFEAFSGELLDWLQTASIQQPVYSTRWLEMSRTLSEARELNMDLTQAAAKLISGLQATA